MAESRTTIRLRVKDGADATVYIDTTSMEIDPGDGQVTHSPATRVATVVIPLADGSTLIFRGGSVEVTPKLPDVTFVTPS